MYDTGRPQNDMYYFCYIEEINDYRHLEKRIADLLGEFKDNKRKEMYVIHFDSLRHLVELLRSNYDKEIDELNKFISGFMRDLVSRPAVIPEPIVLNQITIQHIQNGEAMERTTIDLDKFSEAEQKEIVEKLLRDFKSSLEPEAKRAERKAFENFAKEKNYQFKSRSMWKILKEIITTIENLSITY